MDRVGIVQVGLPGFHIDGFRLPVFGDSCGTSGKHENRLHKSLVDAWYFSGYSNDNPPTEVIGVKGGVMKLNNFAFNLGSGFGVYANNFLTEYTKNTDRGTVKVTAQTIHITSSKIERFPVVYTHTGGKFMLIKVTGVSEEHVLRIDSANSPITTIVKDGIYEAVPTSNGYLGFGTLGIYDLCDILIEQLPSYEGYLCFDGVDDYAACANLPLLEDYTLICRREYIGTSPQNGDKVLASKATFISGGEFMIEYISSSVQKTTSYGAGNDINIEQSPVFYQTKSSYNGTPIKYGSASPTSQLLLGRNNDGHFSDCAIAYFALYGRTLTVQEIEKEKVKLETEWNKRLIK